MIVVVIGIWNFSSYAAWWLYVLAMGLEFLYFICEHEDLVICVVVWRKEDGSWGII